MPRRRASSSRTGTRATAVRLGPKATTWPLALLARDGQPFDVVAFGENSLDFVGIGPRPLEWADKGTLSAFDLFVGGQAATAAVACARQGLRARYVGAFGADDWGDTVRSTLVREHVDVVSIARARSKSRVAMVLVDSRSGDRTVFEFRDAMLALDRTSMPAEALTAGRVLMLDATDVTTATTSARLARASGIRTIVDVDRVVPALSDLLAEIDVIVVPRVFLVSWTGQSSVGRALASLRSEFRPAVAVVTLGPEGSLALAGADEIRTPGFSVEVADTTGAGDAFRAGFVSAWVQVGNRLDLRRILECANATAALNCQAVGAQTGLPRWPEVERFVTKARRARSK